MNCYIRNITIATIANIIVFIIGWGCIVPDQLLDKTHLFGIIGNVEIVKGNTSTVFGVCACMSTLTLIISLVEAIIEDFRRPCFCPTRAEKPRKTPKISGMKISDPTPEKEATGMKITNPTSPEEDKDPKTPTMD